MKAELKKIKLRELLDFSESPLFKKSTNKAFSQERLESYLNNPNAKKEDTVLYFFEDEGEIIAYRTILPDNYGENKEHFGWCSGNWVHPAHRRKGYSKLLLSEAMKDWDNKLMYTNYAPESHALYQATGEFKLISSRSGYCFYLFVSTRKLLANRVIFPAKLFLPIIDLFIAIFAWIKSVFTNIPSGKLSFRETERDEFEDEFEHRRKLCFLRGKKELKWITDYPWVKEGSQKQNYFFSYRARHFYYKYFLIEGEGRNKGFLMFQYRDGVLRVPYFQLGEGGYPDLAAFICDFARKKKIKQLIIFDPVLSEAVDWMKNPFLYKKERVQNIYASWQPECKHPVVNDGDGDYVFS